MSSATRSLLLRYGISVLSPVLALLLTLLLNPLLNQTVLALFIVAVTLSVWWGGLGPGLLSIVLSTLFINFGILPLFAANTSYFSRLISIGVFLLITLLINSLNSQLRTAKQRSDLALSSLKDSETRLRQSEARFRRLVESNIIGVFFPELNGNVRDANDAFLNMLGYSREDLQAGRINWKSLTPPAYEPIDRQKIEELRTQRRCDPFEKAYWHKDGRQIPILVGAAMLEGSQQETVAFVLDLSDRKQAELALRESEERFRNLADTAPVLIWMTDADQSCYYFNQPWLDFTGRSLAQEFGDGWTKGVHPDDLQFCLNTYRTAFDARQSFKMEYRLRRFDGEYRWLIDIGVPRFAADGEFLGYIGTGIDITDRKQAESAIQQLNEILEYRVQERTQQLVATNQELEAFAYSVSHDLRAPLRHISGFVGLLRKQASAQLDTSSQRYLNIITDTTNQAERLIDDLLAFSRMGRAEMRHTTIDMEQLVAEVRRDLQSATQNREVDWTIEPLPSVQGDPSMLRLVFRNLIDNALKYTQPRSIAKITIGSLKRDQEIVFYVQDNGVGFDTQYEHKLFGVFQRLHSDDQFVGNGIGLANVRRIIHRHGGQTWAKSELDRGATFYFSLPLHLESDQPDNYSVGIAPIKAAAPFQTLEEQS